MRAYGCSPLPYLPGNVQQLGQCSAKCLNISRAGPLLKRTVAKKERSPGARQPRLACLRDIRLFGRAVRIEPTPAALRAANSAQPAHDEVALVLRRAAPSPVRIIACLRPHPDS